MTAGRRSRMAVAAALAFAAGCRNCDLVEAELRHQNRKLEQLQAELAQSHAECEMLRNTVQHLSGKPPTSTAAPSAPTGTAPPAGSPPRPADPPVQGASFDGSGAVRSVADCRLSIGTLSRGKDFDGDGRSDGLSLSFSLVDRDGDVAKVPGSAVVEVFEVLTNGRQRAIGVWEFDADQLRRFWRTGIFGSGYQVSFGWQRIPSSESVRAVVHYRLDNGSDFEASKDMRISLTPRLQWHEAAAINDEPAVR